MRPVFSRHLMFQLTRLREARPPPEYIMLLTSGFN